MAFDIHQPVFDRDGMPGKKAEQYLDQLMEFFVLSPEDRRSGTRDLNLVGLL